jgi:hypothetical protein
MPQKKSPVTPPEIDPGTFQLVVQHLNHYATPGPDDGGNTENFIHSHDFLKHIYTKFACL